MNPPNCITLLTSIWTHQGPLFIYVSAGCVMRRRKYDKSKFKIFNNMFVCIELWQWTEGWGLRTHIVTKVTLTIFHKHHLSCWFICYFHDLCNAMCWNCWNMMINWITTFIIPYTVISYRTTAEDHQGWWEYGRVMSFKNHCF